MMSELLKRNDALYDTGQYPMQFSFEENSKYWGAGLEEMYMVDPWHREIDGVVYPRTPYVHPDWNTLKHWHPWPWNIDTGVCEIDIGPYLEEALAFLAELPAHPRGSVMEGTKGLTGMLGEIIYREHLKEIEVPIVRESTSDYDFLIGADSKRVDVKTKGASYTPRGDWDVSIPMGADGPLFACSRRTRTSGVYRPTLDKHLDAFAFVRIETPKRNIAEDPYYTGTDSHGKKYAYMQNAWILGQLSYKDFYMKAFPIVADEKDRRPIAMAQKPRTYQSREDQWNVYHHQLDQWWEPDQRGGEMVLKEDYLEILCS